MEVKKAIELYNFFIKEGYDLGSQENFLGSFQDDKLRVELFNFFTEKEGYDLGLVEDFVLKKKDSSEVIGDQEPMDSQSQQNMEPFSSESSNEPSSPTAPIDPTTGLPFQQQQEQEQIQEDEPVFIDENTPLPTDVKFPERDQTTETYNSGEFFIEGSQEKDTYLEQLVGKNSVTDLLGDLYRSGKQGLIQGNSADEAAALMLSGGDATSEQIQAFLETQENLQSQGATDEMVNFNKIYDAADNKFTGLLQGIVRNPSVILQIGAQTITQLLNPASAAAGAAVIGTAAAGGAGLGATFGGVGAVPGAAIAVANPAVLKTAFAAASTALETSLSFGEFIREEINKRDDLEFDEAGIKAILNNEEAFNRAWKRSVGRGATIGIIDRLSLGMGGKAIKSIKGVKAMKDLTRLQKTKIAGAALGTEALGGGVGESAARAVAGQEQDVRETAFETFGGFGKAPISYVLNTVSDPITNPIKDAVVKAATEKLFPASYTLIDSKGGKLKQTKEDVIDTIENTDDVTFKGLKYKIKNDPDLQKRYDDRMMLVLTGETIRQKLKEAGLKNKKQIDRIVELEIEKNSLEGNTTEVGKQALKQIKEKIAELSGVTDAEVDAKGNTISGKEKVVLKATEDGKNPQVDGLNPLENEGSRTGKESVIINDDGTITIDVLDRDPETNKSFDDPTKKIYNTDRKRGKLLGKKSENDDNVYIVEEKENEVDKEYFSEKERDANERPLIARAEAAAKAIKKLLPGVNFVLHRTNESYERLSRNLDKQGFGKTKKKSRSKGQYIQNSNDIHINMALADGQTVAHEVLHAIINNMFTSANAVRVTRNMADTLLKSIKDPALLQEIKQFQKSYKKDRRNEEALTKFIGMMAQKYDTLKPVEKTTLQKWIASIAKLFSLPKEITNDLIADQSNLKEILTTIGKDLTEGKEIDSIDISAFDTDEMGKPVKDAEGPIPSNIPDDGPDIELVSDQEQLDRGGIDMGDIKRGSINDLSGANAFVFAADQATYGTTKSPSGLDFMFNGGFLYPYGAQSQGGESGWVFSTEQAANRVNTNIQNSDGVGLVMVQAPSGIAGNLQFYDYLNAEIAFAIENGASPKEMVDYINKKLKLTKVAEGLKKKGLPTQIKDFQEMQDLLKTLNFEQRGEFAKTFMSKESYENFGIYPFAPLKTIDGNIEGVVNDPSLKNVQYGDIVSAIQFDKNGKPVRLNEGDPGYHPAYPFSLPGKPIMIFNKAVDVRKVYPNAKPVSGNQTPLGERSKPVAARSAMGGQYKTNVPKDVDADGVNIVVSEEKVSKEDKYVDGKLGESYKDPSGDVQKIVLKTKKNTVTQSDSQTVNAADQRDFGQKGVTKIYEKVYGLDRLYGKKPGEGGKVPRLYVYTNKGYGYNKEGSSTSGVKITAESTRADLIKEVETTILKGLNQEYKIGLKNIQKFLRTLRNDAKISGFELGKILDIIVDENAFTDPASHYKAVSEISSILKDADTKAEYAKLRKKAIQVAKNLKRSIGRILADAVSGRDITLESLIREVIIIDPTVIPVGEFNNRKNVYQDYKDIINGLGDRRIMLDNADEAGIVAQKARNVLEAMTTVESRIPQLREIFLENAIRNQKGDVLFKKTLDFLIENDLITEQDVAIIKNYKDLVNPKIKKVKTKKQLEAERKKLIEEIKKLEVSPSRYGSNNALAFPFLKTREDVREFIELIKDTKSLSQMNNGDLKNIIRLVNTLNYGYAPGIMSRIITKIKAIKDATPISKDIVDGKLKLPTVEGIYSKLKTFSPFNKQSKIYNAIERGQLYNIDRLFGNFKTKKMFNAFFNDMAVNQQQMEVANKKEGKLRDEVRRLLDKAYSKLGVAAMNKVAEADARLMFYRIQLEYLSNPKDKKINPAIEWLDSTIQYLEANRKFDPTDARELEVLKKIRKDYAGKNANSLSSLTAIYKKFKPEEVKALKILQEIDNANVGKSVYAANQRDAAFIPRQNYVHISVRPKSRERVDINKDVINDFVNSTQTGRRPSTKSKSGIERTGLVSPIYTSAINSSERGSKFTNLDYYMTTPVRKANQTFKFLKDNLIERYKGSPPKEVQSLLDALETGVKQSVQNVLTSDFVENDYMRMVSQALQRLGYRTMLTSVPRAGVEYLSNMGFAVLHPKTFLSGISSKNKLSAEEFLNVLIALKSKAITRLTGDSLMSSKVDLNLLSKKSYKGERFVSGAKEKILGLWDATGKKGKNAIAVLADALISSPDKIVMKPMMIGKIADKFKELTGEDIDWKRIGEGDENYLVNNKVALEETMAAADEFVTLVGSSDNPFMARLQGKDAKGLESLWVNFNSFMTTFLKQEYDTSVIGLQALTQRNNSSSLSRAEGAQLLAAVTARMTAYSLGIKIAGELMLELFGVESEEEEKDIELQIGQALTTTFTSLILGRNFGNAFKTIQNYNIELLNAEFGDALRDGEYDQYRDAIQYNIIPLVNTGQSFKGQGLDAGKIAPNFLGAYSPPVKTLAFTLKKLSEPDRKTPEGLRRQTREREERIPFELLGNTGFIPLYRDVRKILLADIYKDMNKRAEGVYNAEEIEELKRNDPREYKKVIYEKKVERYKKRYEKFIDYKRNPRSWREENPGKKKPTRPNKPKR